MTYSSETLARILQAFLKLSEGGVEVSVEEVAEEARVPRSAVAQVIGGLGRVEAALKALELGVDAERVARHLDWREFEEMASRLFERMGFEVRRDVKLAHGGERCQIDLLAYRHPLLLIIDCKHWRKPPSPSEEKVMVEAQEKRMRILGGLAGSSGQSELYLIPVVLTLYQPSKMMVEGHPIAPLSRVRGLVEYLEASYFQVRHLKLRVPRNSTLDKLVGKR